MAMIVQCAHCTVETDKPTGAVNRSKAQGAPLYCSRECAALAKRQWKSPAEKKAEKAAYDAEYRTKNKAALQAKKRAYYAEHHDREKEHAYRQRTMARHVEYCRRPEYREWKRDYDRRYRAAKEYGEFAECFLLVMDIRAECLAQQSDYDIRRAKGTFGKAQQRKRDHDRLVRQAPEIGALGNPQFRQGRQNGSLAG